MKHCLSLLLVCLIGTATARATDFQKDITPIFKTYCYKCHSEAEKKEKGKLVLDNTKRLAEKIDGKIITAGDPEKSSFFKTFSLPADDDDHMPPAKEKQLSPAEVALVKAWITEGAKFTGGGAAPAAAPAAPAPAAPAPAAAMDAAPAATAPAAAGGIETWTSADGKTIKATKLRLEGENVVLQREDGQCFSVPLAKLSADSQAMAKK